MSTIAQQKLQRAIALRGERAVAFSIDLSERRLRDLAAGRASPRPATRERCATALEIEPSDWTTVDRPDLDALERATPEPTEAPDLIRRLTRLYLDPEVSWTDRTRAASIVLRLATGLPPLPTWEARGVSSTSPKATKRP